jgi:Protein of unknown function (DUF1064)
VENKSEDRADDVAGLPEEKEDGSVTLVDYRKVKKVHGFDSKREYDVACKLQALADRGVITELRKQAPFELIPKQKGMRGTTYKADFVYRDENGELVVVDVKGFKTEVYRIKQKLMLWRHGIRILEA